MIKDLMTKNLIIMNINNSIYDVATAMKKYRIGFIPIAKDKKIVGVITDRDIVINAISNNCNNDDKVEDYINKNVFSINIDENIDNALKIMKNEKIKRIIVTNNDKVVGILSISDLLNRDNNELFETIKTIWNIDNKHIFENCEIDEFYL